MYVYHWFRLLNIITWNIIMLKIQYFSEIRKLLYVPKAQIAFIRSCVNRLVLQRVLRLRIYWTLEWSIDLINPKALVFCDWTKDWSLIPIVRVIIYIFRIFYARFHTLLFTYEYYRTVIHSWTFGTSQIIIVILNNF